MIFGQKWAYFLSELKNSRCIKVYPGVNLPKYTYNWIQLPPPPKKISLWQYLKQKFPAPPVTLTVNVIKSRKYLCCMYLVTLWSYEKKQKLGIK